MAEAEHLFRQRDTAGLVLVIDDDVRNRTLLRDLLETHGFTVEEGVNGLDGLQAASRCNPDVILLDVMMPQLDGFEVCRQLKAAPATMPVPVLMVTSLSDRAERLRGIRAGATDFVTKPVDTADLLLRVRNAVSSKRLYDQMQRQYVRLQELEGLRDDLVHMVVHDLRSPLSAISAYLQMLAMDLRDAAPEVQVMVAEALALGERMAGMIATMLDVSRLESGKLPLEYAAVSLVQVAQDTVDRLAPHLARRVEVVPAGEVPPARCDAALIGRVVDNLVGNALKFSDAAHPVRVTIGLEGDDFVVGVRDEGPGIPDHELGAIFDKYTQFRRLQQSSQHAAGLGLTFCRLAIEAHGGRIGVETTVGSGSTFWFRLPRVPAGTPVPESVT